MDYLAILNWPLTFGPNLRSHVVHVEILSFDDDRFEKNVENFIAALSTNNVISRLHIGVQLATVNITDNESEPVSHMTLYNVIVICQLFEYYCMYMHT